jgi:hypothetical protein
VLFFEKNKSRSLGGLKRPLKSILRRTSGMVTTVPSLKGLVNVFYFTPGLTSVCENPCRPYGTRIYFPLYPALRLRLRAGLD